MVHLLVMISVGAMTACQLLARRGVETVGGFPQTVGGLPHFLLKAYTNPYIITSIALTIITAVAWLLALSKAELSYIYPFMALSYLLVAVFSFLIFKEDVSALRWAGIVVICLGVFLVSRS